MNKELSKETRQTALEVLFRHIFKKDTADGLFYSATNELSLEDGIIEAMFDFHNQLSRQQHAPDTNEEQPLLTKKLDVENEKDQEEIYRRYLKFIYFGTPDEIEEEITTWKDLGQLEKKAKQAFPKLERMQADLNREEQPPAGESGILKVTNTLCEEFKARGEQRWIDMIGTIANTTRLKESQNAALKEKVQELEKENKALNEGWNKSLTTSEEAIENIGQLEQQLKESSELIMQWSNTCEDLENKRYQLEEQLRGARESIEKQIKFANQKAIDADKDGDEKREAWNGYVQGLRFAELLLIPIDPQSP